MLNNIVCCCFLRDPEGATPCEGGGRGGIRPPLLVEEDKGGNISPTEEGVVEPPGPDILSEKKNI